LYLTGTANFTSQKTGDFTTNNFILAPGVGYFLSEKLAIEGSLVYSTGKTKDFFDGNVFEVKRSGFGVNAGVKYFWTPASKFSLSVGGNISYYSFKEEVAQFGSDYNSNVIGVNVPVGLHYFVSDSFAITSTWGGLGYSSNGNGGHRAEKTNAIDMGLDMSAISFGLIYKL
jgi:hypothetical protein